MQSRCSKLTADINASQNAVKRLQAQQENLGVELQRREQAASNASARLVAAHDVAVRAFQASLAVRPFDPVSECSLDASGRKGRKRWSEIQAQ